MELVTAVSLIQKGINSDKPLQTWADLGSGDGLFTTAILSIIPSAKVIAVDRNASALKELKRNVVEDKVEILPADFLTNPLPLTNLDGILMANALHFVQHQQFFLERIRPYLIPTGRIVIVEYDTDVGNQWVPYPIPFAKLSELAVLAGYKNVEMLHSIPSRYQGSMYSALLS